MMKHNIHVGLLIMRIALGSIFITHGIQKLQNMEETIGFFTSIGIPAPQFFAYVVALIETFGGIAIILGIFTEIVGLLLAIIMIVAIIQVKFPLGGFTKAELEIALLALAFGLSFTGAGSYSLKRLLNR